MMYRKLCLVLFLMGLFCGNAFASPRENTNSGRKAEVTAPSGSPAKYPAPNYTFTRTPTALMTSYYDYMIGSYNNLPLQIVPNTAGGGYFITYHGNRTATGTRRIFSSYLDASGNIITNVEIPENQNNQGYPALAVDPLWGKPFYTWREDVDNDGFLEVVCVTDAFIAGIPNLFNPMQIVLDTPLTLTVPGGQPITLTDTSFMWPSVVIGASPLPNKHRVFISAKYQTNNASGLNYGYAIAYADFDAAQIEAGNPPLAWNYTTLSALVPWLSDSVDRTLNLSLTTDNSGNPLFAGYHAAWDHASGQALEEPDLDLFICPNYGMGASTRYSYSSHLPSWNPPGTPTSTTGYFVDEDNTPYADTELWWQIMNSSHLNASVDDNGKVHIPGLMSLKNADGGYYPSLQCLKEFVIDLDATPGNQLSIHEIYAQNDLNNDQDIYYQPWDLEAPWGQVDSWTQTNTGWVPDMAYDWNYPHWDVTLHDNTMLYYYNNLKITEANGHGTMAMVWQNSYRAQLANEGDADYAAYLYTPEIFISISENNGQSWSDPIMLNNINTPQLAGLKPMWVYPANKVIYVGEQSGSRVSKLGLMFYNDYSWGSYVINPPAHPNSDGGQVMFMELQFWQPGENPDEGTTQAQLRLNSAYPNPFANSAKISFQLAKPEPEIRLEIYNLRGQKVRTLLSGYNPAGLQELVWNSQDDMGKAVASGIYFCRLSNGTESHSQKLIVLK